MKCNKCAENNAAYYITQGAGSGMKIGFCESCADEIGIFAVLRRVESLLRGYGVESSNGAEVGGIDFPVEFAEKCGSCGTTLKDFERQFRFGCEDCSVVFSSIIGNYLRLLGADAKGQKTLYPGEPPRSFKEKSSLRASNDLIKEHLQKENFLEAAKERDRLEKMEEKHKSRRNRIPAIVNKKSSPPEASDESDEILSVPSAAFAAPSENRLSSCIEIRRNISEFNFPSRLDETHREYLQRYVTGLLPQKWLKGMRTFRMSNSNWAIRKAVEARLFGKRLTGEATLLAVPGFDKATVINDSDHLTIFYRSLETEPFEALQAAMEPLEAVEKIADMAYSPRFGYLTSSPKHLGSGLSVSVLLHLPYSLYKGLTYVYPTRAAHKSLKFEPISGNHFEHHGFFRVAGTFSFARNEFEIISEVFEFADSLVQEERKIRADISRPESRNITKMMEKLLYHSTRSYRLSYPDALRFTTFLTLGEDNNALQLAGFNIDSVIPSLTSAFIMFRDSRRMTVNQCEIRRAELFAELVESWTGVSINEKPKKQGITTEKVKTTEAKELPLKHGSSEARNEN